VQRFNFSSDEIDRHRRSMQDWHSFVRRREAEIAFSLLGGKRPSRALEIGAGDGGQSVTIAKYCDHLVCTEVDEKSHDWLGGATILERDLGNVEYRICDAQDLSEFDDQSFDLIFSSNALEHIPDIDRCLGECRRVLKPEGVMLHAMPNRWWKTISCLLTLTQLRRPATHGVERTHAAEFKAFGLGSWLARLAKNGLKLERVVSLPFYVGHGNRYIPITKAGNWLGLSACYLYMVGPAD
jgi:2-polyprenyl-3-methyl-5-hydroxy-6-metoxy-1,4-benzoquinol methylase